MISIMIMLGTAMDEPAVINLHNAADSRRIAVIICQVIRSTRSDTPLIW